MDDVDILVYDGIQSAAFFFMWLRRVLTAGILSNVYLNKVGSVTG